MTTKGNPNLHNPHLDGDAFAWHAGSTAVFLSHGFTATTAEIRPLAEKLYENGYSVTAPLLPGHGTTPEDLNRVSWQDWAAEGQATLGLMLKNYERVFVAGESMGGVLALHLASQNPQVAGVLLYAPAIALTMSTFDRIKLQLGSLFVSQVSRESLDCADKWQGYPGLPLKGAIQLLKFQEVARAGLAQIHQPVLVFQGGLDKTVAPHAGEIILNGVSSTQKERIWMSKTHHPMAWDVELDEITAKTIEFIDKKR